MSESWYFMFIVNVKWLDEVLSNARMNGSKEYVEYILHGCKEDDILPYDLATEAVNKGMYDSDDLLGILLEKTCDKGENIADVAVSVIQEDIVNYIRHDLLQYRYMVVILDRVWLFTEDNLSSYELEDMPSYMVENGIVSNRKDRETETMFVYRIDEEYHKQLHLPMGNVILTLLDEFLVEY